MRQHPYTSEDPDIFSNTHEQGRVLITFDLDFGEIAARRSNGYSWFSNSATHALLQGAYLNVIRHDPQAVQVLTDELVRRSREHGVILFHAWGRLFQGWLLSVQGRPDEGIEEMTRALAACRTAGSRLGHTQGLKLLAEAHARAGRIEAGLSLVSDAIAMVEETDERLHAASLLRLRGEMLESRGAECVAEAEEAFRRAVEIARDQGARSWELRAAVRLARLLRARGRHTEARECLVPVIAGFAGDSDMPELAEAKELLP